APARSAPPVSTPLAAATGRRRYPPDGLKFLANFNLFCAIPATVSRFRRRAIEAIGSWESPPTPCHNSRTLSQGEPMAVAQKTPSADTKPVADFTKEQELSPYRSILSVRRFEEKAGQMYGMGLIGGFCHLYIGQEAVVLGMQMVLQEGDQVITG